MKGRATCPYCGASLGEPPKRKKLCPECRQPILVRQGRLLTEEQVEIEHLVSRLASMGLTRPVFDAHREQLRKQFGTRASVNDTVWRFLNEAVTRGDYLHRWHCYLEMARLVKEEGKSPLPFYKEANRCTMEHFRGVLDEERRHGVTAVEIRNSNDELVCDACRALEGHIIPIDEALRDMPVPNRCEGVCRCWYVSASMMGRPSTPPARRGQAGRERKGCLATLLAVLPILVILLGSAF